MKSKLEEHFGIWNCHHWATWWNECSYIQVLLHLYFNNVIFLQSTKEGWSWLGKIKSIETPDMLIKKWCAGNYTWWIIVSELSWHVGHSSNILTRYFSYEQWMWKACRNEQHLLSKSQCSSWEHGFCSLYCSWPCSSATWHSYHFGSRFLVTTWSQILQHLWTGAEIWVQFCSCPECWVHLVCCWWYWQKLKYSGCPNTFQGMDDIANILLSRPTLGGILL